MGRAGSEASSAFTAPSALSIQLARELGAKEAEQVPGFTARESQLFLLPDGGELRIGVEVKPWWDSDRERGDETIVLYDLEVTPQGQGLGTRVIETLHRYADAHDLHLAIWHPTADAARFYRRFPWLVEYSSSFDYRQPR